MADDMPIAENNDEEIDLNSSSDTLSDSAGQSQADNTKIESKAPNISSAIPAGSSDIDIIDSILSVPVETLIPWEKCLLPSRGLYYEGWKDGIVNVRAMTIQTEKYLATDRYVKSGQAVDMMINNCCVFPQGFSTDDLLVGDHAYLLYFIRGITYGNIYEFMIKCPACSKSSLTDYDLNGLISTMQVADPSIGSEPFKIVLPYLSKASNVEVYVDVRFMRRRDIQVMVNTQRTKVAQHARSVKMSEAFQDPANDLPDEIMNNNLDQLIVSVNGSNDRYRIRKLCERLHSQDVSAVRKWLNDHTPGISPIIEVGCTGCQKPFRTALPLTDSFFRVNESGGIRE